MYSSQDTRHGLSSGIIHVNVPVPPRFSAGALIGKHGSNIKALQQYSGCKIVCNDPFTSVRVSGSHDCILTAQNLLQQQFHHFAATGGTGCRKQERTFCDAFALFAGIVCIMMDSMQFMPLLKTFKVA